MRLLVTCLAAALTATACGGAAQPAATSAAPTVAAATTAAPTPTRSPTPSPTPATKLTFNVDLRPENEVPPVANEEKSGSAKATVVFDLTRDGSGKITAAKASIDITFSGFPATAQILIGHIHGPGAAGVVAGVKVPFKTDQDNPLPLTNGGGNFKKADVVVDPDLAQQILSDPTIWYVNFHTKLNPGGVVRGQLPKS